MNVHHSAADGFTVGAQMYVRARPGYPEAVDGWLCDSLELGPGKTVVDLGAGTGKFTERLLTTGARVIAVEPLAGMRAELERLLPQAEALQGQADSIPLPDASVDAVTCGQSFHWFASPAAVAEIARVLRPGGQLALVWNVRDREVPWVVEVERIADAHEGDAPRYASGEWRKRFPAPGFGPMELTTLPHQHVGPAEQVVVQRVLTTSFIAALPSDEKERVAEELRTVIAATPELQHDPVAFPYRLELYRLRRV